jgi:hypothetical protein
MSYVKIFVSYSRKDAGDIAEQIRTYLVGFRYDVFTDIDSIRVGDVWSSVIEYNISGCDIFVVIVTYGALYSPHVENEVLLAQREKKRIIPCVHKTLRHTNIKWGLNEIQGVTFDDKYELARNLYSKILNTDSPPPTASFIQPQPKVSNTTAGTEQYPSPVTPRSNETPFNKWTSKPVNKWLLPILPIILVALIGIGVALSIQQSHQPQPSTTTTPSTTTKPKTTAVPSTSASNQTSGTIATAHTTTNGSASEGTGPTALDENYTTTPDTPLNIMLEGYSQTANRNLTAVIVSQPSHGILGRINQGVVTYTPNQGFTGNDSFTFKLYDGKTESINTATVNIRVSSTVNTVIPGKIFNTPIW